MDIARQQKIAADDINREGNPVNGGVHAGFRPYKPGGQAPYIIYCGE